MIHLPGKAATNPLNLLLVLIIVTNVLFGECANLRTTQVRSSQFNGALEVGRKNNPSSVHVSTGSRVLTTGTVATTTCDNIRQDAYKARLELHYKYRVGIVPEGNTEDVLRAIHDAILHSVISSLDGCDEEDKPMYQLDPTFSDELKLDGKSFGTPRDALLVSVTNTIHRIGCIARILPCTGRRWDLPSGDRLNWDIP